MFCWPDVLGGVILLFVTLRRKAEGYYQNIGMLVSSSQSHLSWGFVSSQKGLMELCSGSRQCRTCCLRGCQWGPEMMHLWIKHLKGDVRASDLPGLSSSLAVAFVQTQESYISHSTSSFIQIKQLLNPGSNFDFFSFFI